MFANKIRYKALTLATILSVPVFFIIIMVTDVSGQQVADPKCIPLKGETFGTVSTCAESPVPNGCIDGRTVGSLRGVVELRLTSFLGDTPANKSVLEGVSTIISRGTGRWTLTTSDTIVLDQGGNFTNFVEITGGTGLRSGYTGFAGLAGNIDFEAGTFEAGWEGFLCPPGF